MSAEFGEIKISLENADLGDLARNNLPVSNSAEHGIDPVTKLVFRITDEGGLHMRPSNEIVKIALKHESDCKVELSNDIDGPWTDAKSIMSIFLLCIKSGQDVIISLTANDSANSSNLNAIKEARDALMSLDFWTLA